VSSLFIKKPSRIDALLMIMTLSLLVYSIAQRRMRASMKKANETIPNQINIPSATPHTALGISMLRGYQPRSDYRNLW
jgi:transposase